MTKKEAVDEIMHKAGMLPRGELDTGGSSAMGRAEAILDERDLKIQKRPWRFNTERQVALERESNDEILVPSGTISIVVSPEGKHSDRKGVRRGGRIYDIENETFEWDVDLVCNYVTRFEFHCIPEPIAEYIAADAAVQFIMRHGQQRFLAGAIEDRHANRTAAYQCESDHEHINLLDGSDMNRIRGDRNRDEVW